MKFGYARVSTDDQTTEHQVAKLNAAGCQRITEDKGMSGATRDRPQLTMLLNFVQQGDELVVVALDRLGRNLRDVLNITHELEQKGAHLTVLNHNLSSKDPSGKMMFVMLGMMAEMERSMIRERQAAGIQKARVEGRYNGRVRTIDRAEVRRLHALGVPKTAIARRLKCERSQIYRILDEVA